MYPLFVDATVALTQVPDCSLFGVFDGHGGDMVAHYAAKHFPEFLQRTNLLVPNMPDEAFVTASKAAFELSLMEIDDEMRQLPQVESGQDQSGSTSVMTLLGPRCARHEGRNIEPPPTPAPEPAPWLLFSPCPAVRNPIPSPLTHQT